VLWTLLAALSWAGPPDEGAPRLALPRTDLGVGLNVGLLLPGFKARLIHVTRPGLTIGLDADLGSVVLLTSVTASAVVGYDARLGERQRGRVYGRIGGGNLIVLSSEGGYNSGALNLGGGAEWRPGRWFGLGLEGGALRSHPDTVPYGQLTLMLYLL